MTMSVFSLYKCTVKLTDIFNRKVRNTSVFNFSASGRPCVCIQNDFYVIFGIFHVLRHVK